METVGMMEKENGNCRNNGNENGNHYRIIGYMLGTAPTSNSLY